RDLAANAGLLRILPLDAPATDLSRLSGNSTLRIAAWVHVTDVKLFPEVLARTHFLPVGSELIITTDLPEKRIQIEALLADGGASGSSTVLLTEKTAGRDASAMLIRCRELFLEDRYDLICKLHTKETAAITDTA